MNDTVATKFDIKEVQSQIANLAELVISGFETMNERFDRLETRADKLEARINNLEAAMAVVQTNISGIEQALGEHGYKLTQLDGRLAGMENDIKELYTMVASTDKKFAAQLAKQPAQEQRLRKVEAFARAAARKTGISFS